MVFVYTGIWCLCTLCHMVFVHIMPYGVCAHYCIWCLFIVCHMVFVRTMTCGVCFHYATWCLFRLHHVMFVHTILFGACSHYNHLVADHSFMQFFGDDFLRILLLRYIFCFVVLRLHRGFKVCLLVYICLLQCLPLTEELGCVILFNPLRAPPCKGRIAWT